MHATIRRYEGVDMARTNEVTGKVNETLVPQLRELPGFAGYYLIEAGNGVISSLGLFETLRAGRRIHQARREVDHRRELQHGDPERAEDHERQGRCSQQRRQSPSPSSSVLRTTERARLRRALSSAGPLAWASILSPDFTVLTISVRARKLCAEGTRR